MWLTRGLSAAACRCSRQDPKNRVNCGFPGITSDQCFTSGCCFDSQVPGVPWCFKPLPAQGNVSIPGHFPGLGQSPKGKAKAPDPVSTLDPKAQPSAPLGDLRELSHFTGFEKTTLRPLLAAAPAEAAKAHVGIDQFIINH